MKPRNRRYLILVGCICAVFLYLPAAGADSYAGFDTQKNAALALLQSKLSAVMDDVYVYGDFGLTENHYLLSAKMWGTDGQLVKDMDKDCRVQPYAGQSCIRCQIDTRAGDWGGWMFLNGWVPEGETEPRLNDGQRDGQGLDLSGAEALRFWARGEAGGEKVEFFTAGFGYDGAWGTKLVPYPDSAKKQSLGYVTLTDQWKEYVIPLSSCDMSYTICGFGFVCSGAKSGSASNVFYLDEIRFTGDIAPADATLPMLRSYDTQNVYIQNAAFSYDNALAAMAFISEGDREEAAAILDAFVYAVNHDRQGTVRVRNAYAAGNIRPFAGWGGSARLSGWYDSASGNPDVWLENRYQVGSNVGNTAYVALALLQYDVVWPNGTYADTAAALMDWVLAHCTDGGDGFTGGFDGWAEADPPVVYPLTYKSIEHNIDAYAAFKRLYDITGKQVYWQAAQNALRLIDAMYDGAQGVFYTGTTDDGVTPNTSNIVLDAQVWAALALGQDGFAPYEKALNRVALMRVQGSGYPFCQSNENGGWWAEGTAYTALMYRLFEEDALAVDALNALCSIQKQTGAFPAATVDTLSTGFELYNGDLWSYSQDAHIAPAAWFIMAVNGWNPYQFPASASAANPGDANDDGSVDIMDLVVIVDYIVNGNAPASMAAANANGDGTVDIMDLVFIINLIVNPPANSGAPVGMPEDTARGNTVSVEVPFHSSDSITALELEYTLSPGLTFVNAECSGMVGAGGETNAVFANGNGGVTSGMVTLEVALNAGVTADQSVSVTAVTGANTAGTRSVGSPQTYVIHVNTSALSILTQPADATVSVGNTATFTVEAAGPEPLTYQWYVNTNTGVGWMAVAGATESTYTTDAAVIGDDDFRYFCRVTASEPYLDSAIATLTVVASPTTGDASRPYFLLTLMLLSVCMTSALLLHRKHKTGNQRQ